VGYKDDRVYQ